MLARMILDMIAAWMASWHHGTPLPLIAKYTFLHHLILSLLFYPYSTTLQTSIRLAAVTNPYVLSVSFTSSGPTPRRHISSQNQRAVLIACNRISEWCIHRRHGELGLARIQGYVVLFFARSV